MLEKNALWYEKNQLKKTLIEKKTVKKPTPSHMSPPLPPFIGPSPSPPLTLYPSPPHMNNMMNIPLVPAVDSHVLEDSEKLKILYNGTDNKVLYNSHVAAYIVQVINVDTIMMW